MGPAGEQACLQLETCRLPVKGNGQAGTKAQTLQMLGGRCSSPSKAAAAPTSPCDRWPALLAPQIVPALPSGQEAAKKCQQAQTSACTMQFDDLQWDLDAQNGDTSWQQPGFAPGRAASSRRNGTERTVSPRGNRNTSSRTSEDRSTTRQQQVDHSRDRKRFLSHQEIVQVRIQSNQRLLAALDLFEERVAAEGQSAASAQRSLQVLVVLHVHQPTQ